MRESANCFLKYMGKRNCDKNLKEFTLKKEKALLSVLCGVFFLFFFFLNL